MYVLAQTSGTDFVVALIVIVAGFVLGSIFAAIVRRIANGSSREIVMSSAGAIATLAFSLTLIAALIAALGIVNNAALEQLGTDVALFMPRLLSAAIVLIVGNIVGSIVETGIARSLGHVSAELRERVPSIVKFAIQGFVVVIAANQLGIDTTIISVVVASIFFGIALSLALLAGLGGRGVAEQVAAGRALRRELSVGDTVRLGDLQGEVSAIGSTSTQITNRNDVVFVPNSDFLDSPIEIIDAAPDDETT